MVTIGIYAALAIMVAVLAWYNAANRRFCERVLGPEAGPRPNRVGLTELFRAGRAPALDDETEYWRIRNNRRFRIWALLIPFVGAGVPLLFGLIGEAYQVFSTAGTGSLVILAAGLVLEASLIVRAARLLYGYGNGRPMSQRSIALALAGTVAMPLMIFAQLQILR